MQPEGVCGGRSSRSLPTKGIGAARETRQCTRCVVTGLTVVRNNAQKHKNSKQNAAAHQDTREIKAGVHINA